MNKPEQQSDQRYVKERLLRSSRWSARERNQLAALLRDGELYTVSQAQRAAHTFANRRVE